MLIVFTRDWSNMKKRKIIRILLMAIIILFTGCDNGNINLDQGTEITVTPTKESCNPEVSVTPNLTPTATATITPTLADAESPSPTLSDENSPDSTLNQVEINIETKINELLNEMTLEEKVGQLFFVRLRDESAINDIKKYYLGGYILFGDDFKDKGKDDIKSQIASYQAASNIPMLIGVDEEGGIVNRVSKYKTFRAVPFHSPQSLFNEGGFELVKSDTKEKAILLKSLGINVNLAPVCDVSTNPTDFIYERAFGKDAAETAKYVNTVVSEMNAQGIGCTLKHFPGYGNNIDTHTGIAIDERSYDTFLESDFIPFKEGIKAGAGSILVSHNIVKSMDDTLPASLSPSVHDILRNELGYVGIIMTDDLSMDAIKQYTNDKEAAVLAITAGNDLIIASNFDEQIPAVMEAVNDNTISEDRIDESVKRVLMWKINLGLINIK
jgi:beta-N-acetylhexosaminidase